MSDFYIDRKGSTKEEGEIEEDFVPFKRYFEKSRFEPFERKRHRIDDGDENKTYKMAKVKDLKEKSFELIKKIEKNIKDIEESKQCDRTIDKDGNVRNTSGEIILFKGKKCPRCLNIGHNSLSCRAKTNIYGDIL